MICPSCGSEEPVAPGDSLLWCSACGGTFALTGSTEALNEALRSASVEVQHEMQEVSIYTRLEHSIGSVLCGRSDPCTPCRDAANRIVVHRKEVRDTLLLFARQEADLDA